jgi:hypothetical protein
MLGGNMGDILEKMPLLTWFVFIVGIIIVVVGAIQVITGKLDYIEWAKWLVGFLAAAGVNGVGKGLHKIGSTKQPVVKVDEAQVKL